MKNEMSLLAATLFIISPAAASEPFPKTGQAKLAAYTVCKSLGIIDMGAVGSQSSADCSGIVKSVAGASPFDNLAIRCLEELMARVSGYRFDGTCIESDADGDKLYLTYTGPESGPVALIGGSGKYENITGEGTWAVADAPGNSPALFAFTLSYDVKWSFKAK